MHQPIRALVLDQGPGLWGAQRYLISLRPLLAERGVHLTLASPPELDQFEYWRDSGYPTVALSLPVERSIRNGSRLSAKSIIHESVRSMDVPRRIANAFYQGGFDVLLSNSHWTHLDAALAARFLQIPTALTLHETSRPGTGARLRNIAIRNADRTIAVSGSITELIAPGLADKVVVIPNGVDTARFSPGTNDCDAASTRARLGIPSGHRMVLAATRLDPSKNIDHLIDVAEALDQTTVVIAGSTSSYPDYERHIHARVEAMPSGRVKLIGRRDDIPELLRAADIYLHTGVIEGMPLGLIEAQSSGVPVVAYDAAGVSESVRHQTTGFVVAPGDVEHLIQWTRVLSENNPLRESMGRTARQHAVASHRIERQADANARVISALAVRRRHLIGTS